MKIAAAQNFPRPRRFYKAKDAEFKIKQTSECIGLCTYVKEMSDVEGSIG